MAVPQSPDIAGFKDAMRRGRRALGTPAIFRIPQTPVWPLGTQLGPDGEPYDPAIKPTSGGGYDEVVKTCGTIFKQASKLRPGADERFAPGGEFSGMDAILDLDSLDYPDVQDATHVTILGLHFKIEEWKPGGIQDPSPDRWLVYCQAQ